MLPLFAPTSNAVLPIRMKRISALRPASKSIANKVVISLPSATLSGMNS